jgi:hypothetical protein
MRSKTARRSAKIKMVRALSGMFDTVRPTSPYPSTYAGFPQDMDDWNCGQWKSYYSANKLIMGKDKAIALLERDADSIGSFATGQMCKYDCSFVEFFKKEGVNVGWIGSKLYCAAENVGDAAVKVSESVENVARTGSGVTDFFADVANSKLLLLAGAGVGGYFYFRNKK